MILVCDIVSRSLICCFANNENGLLLTKWRYVLAGAWRRLGLGGVAILLRQIGSYHSVTLEFFSTSFIHNKANIKDITRIEISLAETDCI